MIVFYLMILVFMKRRHQLDGWGFGKVELTRTEQRAKFWPKTGWRRLRTVPNNTELTWTEGPERLREFFWITKCVTVQPIENTYINNWPYLETISLVRSILFYRKPLDTWRCFNFYKTSIPRRRHRIDVL